MLRYADNPPMLSPRVASVREMTGRWHVGHTKSRFEKSFAQDLLHMGIGYYLPMLERTTISGGRRRRVLAPLFTSYVFFCGTDQDRYRAMTTNRLCQVLPVADQGTLVTELAALEQALARNADLEPHQPVAPGRRYRIGTGPFEGMEGVVVTTDGRARFVLQVSFLGQAVAMDVDAHLLEPIPDDGRGGAVSARACHDVT